VTDSETKSWLGRRVRSYEVLSRIGAGGMGEVYRAKDTKLGREVALKVLSEEFADDPERVTRFEREARLLAALNHPNVAAIHGLEEFEGRHVLVLELVEGETLAERIARGPIPIAEALPFFRQIAAGLEAAHEKGIVHRDLKPSNVTVTPEGQVKVLDFGLAKAFRGVVAVGSDVRTETAWDSQTGEGRIVGTVSYMSPEQARGLAVDKRTDVWAFGCVLYEALTGRRAFAGGTVSDTLAAVLEREVDWNALPAETPGLLRSVLRRCLQKDRDRRLHDIADARIEIEEAVSEPSPAGGAGSAFEPAPKRRWAYAATAAAVAVAAAMGIALWAPWRTTPLAERPVMWVVVPTHPLEVLEGGPFALSPDDRQLVYAAVIEGKRQLYLHEMASGQATPVPGTEDGEMPFFSPDGLWIGFHAGGQLKKVSLQGGPPLPLTDGPLGIVRGVSWGPDDSIVFGKWPSQAIWRVSAEGGASQALTVADQDEFGHCWPQMLPGGRSLLFTELDPSCANPRVFLQSLETGEKQALIEGGTAAQYLPTGHLVYAREGSLLAAPFDLGSLELTGPSVPLVDIKMGGCGMAYFSVSENGSLAFLAGGGELDLENRLVWVDRQGREEFIAGRTRINGPRLSPDGNHIADWMAGDNPQLWLYEFARDTFTQLTVGRRNYLPIWTPDSRRLVFSSSVSVEVLDMDLFWMPADGSGPAEELLRMDLHQAPASWSPDGKELIFWSGDRNSGFDIWVLPVGGEGDPRPLLAEPANEYQASLSPDGGWLAYVSDETGRDEVYVVRYPRPDRKWTISTEGGTEPTWASDGRELFYRNGEQMMVVDILMEPKFTPMKPQALFAGPYKPGFVYFRGYDVAPDGRFVMVKREEATTQVNVIFNWIEELKRRVPTG
jgi:serine/threonine-protein kinase